jgi:Bacterial Ig-like domain
VRHALTAVGVLALAAACASPGLPPGGPTVNSFPRVIATLPDTNAINAKPNKVLVRYDDVIGEQANGGELSRNVLISPWDGEPRVEWKRTGMTIRPRGNWRANTAYTITILPGIADLKGKPIPFPFVMQFSTGGAIPKNVVRGVAFDWAAARAVPKATIQAVDIKDTTLVYITAADSTGRFELGSIPAGTYLLRAIDERTANRTIDPREPWDSVRVTVSDSARADLYMFVHDTLPVRISELRLADSTSISLTMDKPLLPGAPLGVSAVRVVSSDSTVLQVDTVLTADEQRLLREREDSIARSRDTTQRAADVPPSQRRTIDPTRRRDTSTALPPPVAARKAPTTDIVIRMRAPLAKGATYRVTLTGLRNLMNVEGTATRLLIVPKPEPIDSTRLRPPAGRDSAGRAVPPGAARDSTRRVPPATRADSARAPVVPPTPPRRPPAAGAR